MTNVWDIGSDVPLSVNVYDSAGALADGGTVTVTIKLPDQTTVGPTTVTSSPTGVYTYNYTTVQEGLHQVAWAATVNNISAYTDNFEVRPAFSEALISVADARGMVGSTVTDDQIRLYISAATYVIESIVGPIIQRTYSESYDGGDYTIGLLHYPIVSVTSVVEYIGSVGYTLTNQPYGSSVSAYGYIIDNPLTGVISRRTFGSYPFPFQGTTNAVQVTYVAGRSTVPANLQMAAREQLRFSWQLSQQGNRPSYGEAPDSTPWAPSGFAVPRSVIEWCGADRRVPGIG